MPTYCVKKYMNTVGVGGGGGDWSQGQHVTHSISMRLCNTVYSVCIPAVHVDLCSAFQHTVIT